MYQIETPRRLSESMLWPLTVEFYENLGAAAWTEGAVPSRISCNAYIADAYARVIVGYLRDVGERQRAGALDPAATVSIVELGAGAGNFGFLVARGIRDAVAAYGPDEGTAPFRYLMTDVAESNVRDWTANPSVKALVDEGVMDLVALDVSDPGTGRSLVSGAALPAIVSGGPVVLLANYLFDSLFVDVFQVEAGELLEVKVGLETEREVTQVVGSPQLFKQLRFRQEPAPMTWPYYPEPAFDEILRATAPGLEAATFLFPLGALRCIAAFRALGDGHLLVLMSDKARSSLAQIEGHKGVGLTLTGTFSSTVNVEAIGRWVSHEGGTVKFPSQPKVSFDTYGFVLGGIGDTGETEAAFARHVRQFGPATYWGFIREIMASPPRLTARALVSLTELTRHDLYFIVRMEAPLLKAIETADADEKAALKRVLERALDLFYPDSRDIFLTLGRLFQDLGEPRRAIECYQRSTATAGERSAVLHNVALCLGALGDIEEAAHTFRRALETRQREARRRPG